MNLVNNIKNSDEILLSICIPTYFRANRIYRNLQNLVKLPNENIEFVVVDDESPDETKEKVLSISDPRIKFYRNEVNLGQEANVINTFPSRREVQFISSILSLNGSSPPLTFSPSSVTKV